MIVLISCYLLKDPGENVSFIQLVSKMTIFRPNQGWTSFSIKRKKTCSITPCCQKLTFFKKKRLKILVLVRFCEVRLRKFQRLPEIIISIFTCDFYTSETSLKVSSNINALMKKLNFLF